jgi:hypothetical protein
MDGFVPKVSPNFGEVWKGEARSKRKGSNREKRKKGSGVREERHGLRKRSEERAERG